MKTRLSRIAMASCLVALCMALPTALLAQTDPPPANSDRPADNTMSNRNATNDTAGNTTVTGKVVSTSGSTLVIETDGGNRMTFDTTGSTLPYGATVGSRVQVAYAPNQNGSVNRISTVTMASNDTATADNRYGTPSTTTGTADMNMNHPTTTTHTDNSDMYASNTHHLPKTASLMPLLGILGIFALAAGVAVRVVRLVS